MTLTKRLVFIGTGYFLNENTGLQASVNDSWVTAFTLDSLSSGSQFLGLRINQAFLQSNTDNILFTRCRLSISPNTNFPGSKLSNLVVNKCFISSFNFGSSGYVFEDLQLTNSIVNELFSVANSINSLIRKNIFLNNLLKNESLFPAYHQPHPS